MARPVTISDEQILDAAREVFLEEGFTAQTARIAARAGVSEGSLFNRFKTKAGLFLAAIGIPLVAPWHETLDRLSGKGDLRKNLVEIFRQMLDHDAKVMPRVMMLWASKGGARLSPPEIMKHLSREPGMEVPPPIRDIMKLGEFFAREMELRRMRRCDPRTAAIVFDSVVRSASLMGMLGAVPGIEIEPRDLPAALVKFLWPSFDPSPKR
jgi:AcrR family transcriptional regulator